MGVAREDSFSTNDIITAGVILGIFFPYIITLAFAVWKQRFTPRIAARKPYLILIANVLELICVFFYMLQLMIYNGTSLPCWIPRVSALLTAIPLCTLYSLRGITLLFQYEIEEALAIFTKKQSEASGALQNNPGGALPRIHISLLFKGPGGWYIRHRRFLRTETQGAIMGVEVLLLVVLAVFVTRSDVDCDSNTPTFINMILVLIHVPVFVWLVVRIWKFDRDSLWIKQELMWSIFICIIAIVFAIPPSRNPIIQYPLLCVAPILLATTSNAVPLFKSARQMHLEFEKDRNIRTLSDLLSLPEGFQSFLIYVQKEFASESVLFWRDASQFRDKYLHDFVDFKQCVSDCKVIFDTYVSELAPFQINISHEARRALLSSLTATSIITSPAEEPEEPHKHASDIALSTSPSSPPTSHSDGSPPPTVATTNASPLPSSPDRTPTSTPPSTVTSRVSLVNVPKKQRSSSSFIGSDDDSIAVTVSTGSGGPPPSASSGAAGIGTGGGKMMIPSIIIPVTIPETDVAPSTPLPEFPESGSDAVKSSKHGKRSISKNSQGSRTPKLDERKVENQRQQQEIIPAHDLARVFDAAIAEVLHLLEDDTLSRYLQSDEYKAFQRWVEEEAQEKGSKGSKGSKEKGSKEKVSKEKGSKEKGSKGSKDKDKSSKESKGHTKGGDGSESPSGTERSIVVSATTAKTHQRVIVSIQP